MGRLFTVFLLTLFVSFSSAVKSTESSSLSAAPDKEIRFKIFLNDREVGSHRFTLKYQGEKLLVSSTMSLDFTLFMVKKIKYRHQAN